MFQDGSLRTVLRRSYAVSGTRPGPKQGTSDQLGCPLAPTKRRPLPQDSSSPRSSQERRLAAITLLKGATCHQLSSQSQTDLLREQRASAPGFHARLMTAPPTRVSKRFPLDNFTYCLTLFSKFFATFPHGTCSLSVSRRYLALEGIYLPS